MSAYRPTPEEIQITENVRFALFGLFQNTPEVRGNQLVFAKGVSMLDVEASLTRDSRWRAVPNFSHMFVLDRRDGTSIRAAVASDSDGEHVTCTFDVRPTEKLPPAAPDKVVKPETMDVWVKIARDLPREVRLALAWELIKSCGYTTEELRLMMAAYVESIEKSGTQKLG